MMVVVASRFRVDEDAMYLGRFELELVFETSNDLVHVLHFERVGQGAVAGDVDAITDTSDADVMDVEDLWEPAGRMAQVRFDLTIALDAYRQFDGRWLTLDMGKHGSDLRHLALDLVLDAAHEVMGLA